MNTHATSSVVHSLIQKAKPEPPDWRLLSELLRFDALAPVPASRIAAILRALSRAVAAGIWMEKRPRFFAALSGSNIRDLALQRPYAFEHLASLDTFSAVPINAQDLPLTWRAAAWPDPWLISHPLTDGTALLFLAYATRPSNCLIGNLEFLVPTIANWLDKQAIFEKPAE
jgi:hypothetical protein